MELCTHVCTHTHTLARITPPLYSFSVTAQSFGKFGKTKGPSFLPGAKPLVLWVVLEQG